VETETQIEKNSLLTTKSVAHGKSCKKKTK